MVPLRFDENVGFARRIPVWKSRPLPAVVLPSQVNLGIFEQGLIARQLALRLSRLSLEGYGSISTIGSPAWTSWPSWYGSFRNLP